MNLNYFASKSAVVIPFTKKLSIKITISRYLMLVWLFIASALILNASAYSQTFEAADHDPYFDITDVLTEVTEVTEENTVTEDKSSELAYPHDTIPENYETKEGGGSGLQIIELALKAWEIIEKNKPVVSLQNKFASALPEASKTHWNLMTGWKPERSFKYTVTYKNVYGMKVVDIEYQVKLMYGASMNGKGRYIASARVLPTRVDVLWGYKLDMKVEVPNILNMGSAEDPLAMIQLDVNYTVSSMVKSETMGESYQLQGDGLILDTKNNRVIFSRLASK